MRFDQGSLAEIHARVDIAAFIGAYVPLRKRGNDLVGLCPFHSEKTPSFHVHPDKGFFKCFGCGAGGDVITFAQRIENVPFGDAVRMLAQKSGVELEPEDPRTTRMRSEREAIYDANRLAAAYFERMLQSPGAERAREYCRTRELTEASIAKFHIGYAPDTWSGLTDDLRRNGVDLELAAKAGLVKRGERGFYDFYRDRLMVPTYATTGEVIAFGGRALGSSEPKYLNTAATPVHTKGKHLFGLNVARRAAARERTLIVVEGYLDCIALHQAGFDNAVASLGTSFTQDQARELRKHADGIFLCFDGDAAGNEAAAKAVEIAAQVIEHAGSSVQIIALPGGSDPDGFVRERGAEAFRDLMRSAKPAIEFRLEREAERLRSGFSSPSAIARDAESLIQRMTPHEEWDRWRVWVAKRLQVNENDLRNSRFLANAANFAPRAGLSPASRHVPFGLQSASFEAEVLSIVLEEPRLLRVYAPSIPADRFRNEVYRRMYARLVEHADRLEQPADVFGLFADDNEGIGALSALGRRDKSSTARYEGTDERRAHLERVVERLQLDDERRRYQELSRRIDDLATAGQHVSTELRDEFEALVAKLKR